VIMGIGAGGREVIVAHALLNNNVMRFFLALGTVMSVRGDIIGGSLRALHRFLGLENNVADHSG